MRFYLNVPLVAGYVLMATTACLGMLQFVAGRGDYAGMSLFTGDQKRGMRLGAALLIGALLAYVLFAPEILTPGPAGTEVAEMFALCALGALGLTLVGADRRIRRARQADQPGDGEPLTVGDLPARLYHSLTQANPASPRPAVVLLPDPAGFVVAPAQLVTALCQAGIAVLALDAQGIAATDGPYARQTLLGHLSTALAVLDHRPEVDAGRIGLLGLGLGGNAVLHAATTDRPKVALAVSPVGKKEAPDAGLYWLRELSYFQIWRWRRLRPTLQHAAADLDMPHRRETTAALLWGEKSAWATGKTLNYAETLTLPTRRHFTLLESDQAIGQTVTWFQDQLTKNK